MPVRPNAVLTFGGYEILDGDLIRMHFVCFDPGPGEPNDIYIVITDAELTAATTTPLLRTLLLNKLNRKLRAAGVIATRLDPFVGQTLTVI